MSDPAAVAFTAQSIALVGIPVSVQRVSGQAPSATTVSVDLIAVVRAYAPDTQAPERAGYGSNKPGGITQNDREIILMARDLATGGFPLPLRKNDRILITGTSDVLTITRVDPYRRAMAGAIEAIAATVP